MAEVIKFVIDAKNQTDKTFKKVDSSLNKVAQSTRKAANESKKTGEALGGFGSKVSELNKKAQSLDATLKKAFAAGFVVASVTAITRSVLTASAEFERLKTSLTTVFGSQEVAAQKFEEINKFASKTPFTIQQVTEAAIKMKSLGLDPSTASLESMGNTASAMGKPLMQFVEAVADATTGEMERLKEFGIRAKQEGERVTFIFKGMETTVNKSASSIQDYLLELGNTEFAGAIEAQAETLDGVFSTLKGAADTFAASLAEETGLAEAAKTAAKFLTRLINKATEGLKSATLEDDIDRLTEKLEKLQSGTKRRGRTSLTFDEEAIAGIQAEIDAKKEQLAAQEEVLAAQKILDDQEAARKLAKQEAKEAAEAEAGENKRLKEMFGGDPQEVLAQIENQFLSEQELIQQAKVQQLATLEKFRSEDLISEQRYNALAYKTKEKAYAAEMKLQQQAEEKKKAEDKKNKETLKQGLAAFLGDQHAAVKAAGIAEAIINTYIGVSKTLAAYPYPFNLALAAAHTAIGLQQVSAIKSASGGSKGLVAHGGLTNNPEEQTALILKNERIVSPRQNRDLEASMEKIDELSQNMGGDAGGGTRVDNVEMNIVMFPNVTEGDFMASISVEDFADEFGNKMIDALNRLNDRGIRPDFVTEAV